MMKKILSQIEGGNVGTDLLAQELDIRRGILDAVLEMAVRKRYVEKVSVNVGCSGCPVSGNCEMEFPECGGSGVYVLTSKGRGYIEDSLEGHERNQDMFTG